MLQGIGLRIGVESGHGSLNTVNPQHPMLELHEPNIVNSAPYPLNPESKTL